MKFVLRMAFAAALVAALCAAACVSPAWAQETTKEAGKEAHTTSADFATLLFVLMLSTLIGLGVITRVSRLLHTPLMSLTNAISAIAIVGAILVAGPEHGSKYDLVFTIVGAIAVAASTANIVSGFLITDRMLKMFKRQEPQKP